jgi:hypothetical protein
MLVAFAISPAAAASRTAASRTAACLSQSAAGKAWPSTWLKSRVVDGSHCWYAPGKRMVETPKLASARSTRVIDTPDTLEPVKGALCGGPCPRFDLDEPVYRALCGGPCPDFRFIDTTRTIWRTSAGY